MLVILMLVDVGVNGEGVLSEVVVLEVFRVGFGGDIVFFDEMMLWFWKFFIWLGFVFGGGGMFVNWILWWEKKWVV